MRFLQKYLVFLALIAAVCGGRNPAAAQAPVDPFGAGADPAAPAASAAPAAAPGAPTENERNPVVLAIRDSNPTTPDQLMFAVKTLFDIGRTDDSKEYLKKLLAANPDEAALTALNRKYGSGVFFELSRDHRMEPEGGQLADAVRAAAFKASRDPARLAQLVKNLSSSPAAAYTATEELRAAEDAALQPIFAALADGNRAAEHPAIRAALVELGPPLTGALIGSLETPDQNLRVQIIDVLGRMKARSAVRHLVGPLAMPGSSPAVRQAAADALALIVGEAPTQRDVEEYLHRQIKIYDAGTLPGRVDSENMIEMWRWDDRIKTVVPIRLPGKEAAMMEAARLSMQLNLIAPSNTDYRRLFFLTNFEFIKSIGGPSRPLASGPNSLRAIATAAGPEAIEAVLAKAIEENRVLAATAAAEVLGDIANPALLNSRGGQPGVLASALQHGDRRLRLAAARAILAIDPQEPFAGSSHLPETLAYLARTAGSRRVLVVHPKVGKAKDLSGLLGQLGYDADAAQTGNQAIKLAMQSPDYEFVLISDLTSFPDAKETVQLFRRDPRISRLPIAIMAREENLRDAENFTESDPLLLAFPRPHTPEGIHFQGIQLLELAGRDHVGYDERLDHAAESLDLLAKLAAEPRKYGFYDLLRHEAALLAALDTPQLTDRAAAVLGLLGSPRAQQALVTLASLDSISMSVRQIAAQHFAKAVQQRGVLLTSKEILEQYDRYNQSETKDAETQQVMASLLDAIEARSRQATGAAAPSAPAPAPAADSGS